MFNIGFPAHFRHLFTQFHQFLIQFRPEKLTAFKPKVQFRQIVIHIRFCQSNLAIQHSNSSIVAKRVTNARIKYVILSNKFITLSFKFVKCYWAFTSGRRF